jgi:uncharacterized CHY-type Zn-finger protein
VSNELAKLKEHVRRLFRFKNWTGQRIVGFKCARCNQLIPCDTNQTELDAQMIAIYGKVLEPGDRCYLCDPCTVLFLAGKA